MYDKQNNADEQQMKSIKVIISATIYSNIPISKHQCKIASYSGWKLMPQTQNPNCCNKHKTMIDNASKMQSKGKSTSGNLHNKFLTKSKYLHILSLHIFFHFRFHGGKTYKIFSLLKN